MSNLVVVGYDDLFKGEEVRLMLRKMQKDYPIDLEDAVVAVKDEKGKVKLHQAVNLTAAGAITGGFWGSLIGLIFLNPILGAAVGASAGAVSGTLTDVGINDKFMKELEGTLNPGSSALFVLVRKATPDKVLDEVKGAGGKILKTSLSHDDEAKLEPVFERRKEVGRWRTELPDAESERISQRMATIGGRNPHVGGDPDLCVDTGRCAAVVSPLKEIAGPQRPRHLSLRRIVLRTCAWLNFRRRISVRGQN